MHVELQMDLLQEDVGAIILHFMFGKLFLGPFHDHSH